MKTKKIKVGDFVFCLGDGIAIFPVVSVDEERGTAFLDPAVYEIGIGGNESLDKLELVRDSEHAESFPQFCEPTKDSQKLKTEPNDQDILRAYDWYAQHTDHIDPMVLLENSEFPPSGSDCHQPTLWKPAHWKWLLARKGIEILANEVRRLKCLLRSIHDNIDPDRLEELWIDPDRLEELWDDILAVVNEQ